MPDSERIAPPHRSDEEPVEYLPDAAFLEALLSGARRIAENHQHLSALDRATGDGDHGTTMLALSSAVTELLNEVDSPPDLPLVLRQISMASLEMDSGAVGPLFSALFSGMSESAGQVDRLDADSMVAVFEGGVSALKRRTKARPGDKTLMCALVPAVDAMRRAVEDGSPIRDVAVAGEIAARDGAESTCDIVAKYGRAKYQGERSIGHPDPGATSVALLLSGYASGMPKRVGDDNNA